MGQRRVVITGIGVINALGIGKQEYFQSMLDGVVGIKRISAFDPGGFPSQIAGESPALKMNKLVPKAHRKATKLMSRDIELVVVAADYAVRDAKLKTKGTSPDDKADIDPKRSGVNIGAGLISCDLLELGSAVQQAEVDGVFDLKKWGSEGMNSLTPLWLLKYLPNMLNCHISIIHDLQGANNSMTCGEASGLLSVGEAYRIIQRDKADVMVAGGADSKVNAIGLLRQCFMNRVSTIYNDKPEESCRPFDRDADGTVIGEGAGVVVLEELEHALARNAPIYAEVVGFGASCNHGPNIVDPEEDCRGVTIALEKAMAQASFGRDDVDMLVATGTAIPSQDRAEAKAIGNAFGEHVKDMPILVTKSRIGNCGAGAAAIDIATMVMSIDQGVIPQAINCPNPIPEDNLNLVTNGPLEVDIQTAMTCCYTYGGQTGALAVRKFKG